MHLKVSGPSTRGWSSHPRHPDGQLRSAFPTRSGVEILNGWMNEWTHACMDACMYVPLSINFYASLCFSASLCIPVLICAYLWVHVNVHIWHLCRCVSACACSYLWMYQCISMRICLYPCVSVCLCVSTLRLQKPIELTFRKMNEGPRDPKSFGIWWYWMEKNTTQAIHYKPTSAKRLHHKVWNSQLLSICRLDATTNT